MNKIVFNLFLKLINIVNNRFKDIGINSLYIDNILLPSRPRQLNRIWDVLIV